LINLERVSKGYGGRMLLSTVSLGIGGGDRIGVVGRNGDGKSTLLRILAGLEPPEAGRVTHTGGLQLRMLGQHDEPPTRPTGRDLVLGGRADHEWASRPESREVVEGLLAGVDLERPAGDLSGGERRRVSLARLLLEPYDLVLLDEPTNHLDVEAVDWLARHLRDRSAASLIVTHDRWFLDAVCSTTWELHDATVDSYEGGYAAFVLAKAERLRQAEASETRRRNLIRKELAWLRRGPPARTSKPRFRTEAANALIADEPPARDSLALTRVATRRLGKDVLDLEEATIELGGKTLLDCGTWRLGPGDRVGLVGVNGSGKTTVLRMLSGDLSPDSGRLRTGRTVRLGYLAQVLEEPEHDQRVLESLERIRRVSATGAGRDVQVTSMLERFGFTGDRLTARVEDLSGGERRRLRLFQLILDEPNVLLLDEPTNDLDIETLNVVEDFLDGWPGTLVVVSHDRYFLERVCDTVWALLGDGRLVMLPGGVDEYLDRRRRLVGARPAEDPTARRRVPEPAAGERADAPANAVRRTARKELARIERQLARLAAREAVLHEQMAEHATDHLRLTQMNTDLQSLQADRDELELQWLAAAEAAED
ncbi:MAG: ABC-F family ATP-binding cassette domain-containing protein, partial [Nocardioidaceae bacterium]